MTVEEVGARRFDGRSARPSDVHIGFDRTHLHVRDSNGTQSYPLKDVHLGEATRHGARLITLPGGAQLEVANTGQLQAALAAQGVGISAVDRMTQSWAWVLAAIGLTIALMLALYRWGVPAGAQWLAPLVPQVYQKAVGDAAFKQLDGSMLKPSTLHAARKDSINQRWSHVIVQAFPQHDAPEHRIVFRSLGAGPNAFALPGGTIVMTDEMVELMRGDDDAVIGVLAHELGHLKHHHSMRSLIEVSALSVLSGLFFGDYGGLVANVPLLIGQFRYSRDHESQADQESLRIMRAAGIDSMAMVRFFEKARAWRPPGKEQADPSPDEDHTDSDKKDKKDQSAFEVFSTHPLDEDRIRTFRQGR